MTLSLWTEASRDLDAETSARRMANAKVAVAGFWPFLSLAQSETEFDHRLALASDHIANAVPTDLLQPIEASLREDYRLLHTAVDPKMLMSDGPNGGGVDFGAGAPKGGDGVNPADLQTGMGAGAGAGGGGAPSGTSGTAPAGGSAPGANTPQQPDPNSTNTPMTARLLTEGIRGPETGAGAGFGGTDTGSGVSGPDGGMVQGPNSQDNPNLPAGPTPPAGGAPPGGSAPGGNTPQPGAPGGGGAGAPGAPSPQDTQMSMNTPMTAQGVKDAEGEDDEDDDGKPPWLKDKIKKKKGAYWHAGAQRWVAARVGTDPEDHPTRREADEDAAGDRPSPWVDPDTLGESFQDPWRVPKKTSAAFFHHGQQRWVVAAVEQGSGGGNPDYFTGGPEAGPNTGQTGQYPMHPTGADPEDGINSMFPMQPSPWTAGEPWKEVPMNFSPPNGNQRAGSRHPFAAAGGNREVHRPGDRVRYEGPGPDSRSFEGSVIYGGDHPEYGAHYRVRLDDGSQDWGLAEYTHKVGAVDAGWSTGDFSACDSCSNPIKRVKTSWGGAWTHTGAHGLAGDDDHEPQPRSTRVDKRQPRSDSPHHRYTMPATGRRVTAEEGVEGRPGPNPEFFAGGAEGVSGDQGGGFPADISEHEVDRLNELYGPSPIDGGFYDPHMTSSSQTTGSRRFGEVEEFHRAPRPEFNSPEERERYRIAREDEAQQDSRASFTGVRHTAPGGGMHGPYHIQESGDGYQVVNDRGEVKGTHDSHDKARDQQKALYANTREGSNRQHHRVTDHNPKVDDDGRASETSEDHDHIRPVHPRKKREHEAPEEANEGHKHKAARFFYDPADPGVRMVAAESGSPFSSQTGADPTDPIDSEFGGEAQSDEDDSDNEFGGGPPAPEAGGPEEQFGSGSGTPQTTPPRQLPSDGAGGGGENPFDDGPPGDSGDPSVTGGEGGQHPGSDLPEGSGSDMVGQGGSTPTDTDDPSADVGKRAAFLWRHAEQSGQSYDRPDDDDPTGAGDEFTHNTWDGPMRTRPRQQADDRKINTPQRPGQPIPTVSSPGAPGDPEQQREASRVARMVTQGIGGGW